MLFFTAHGGVSLTRLLLCYLGTTTILFSTVADGLMINLIPKLVTLPLFSTVSTGKSFQNCPISQNDSIDTVEKTVSDEYVNTVLDEVTVYKVGDKNIIRPYQPDRLWLWRAWDGTLFQHGLQKAMFNMAITAVLSLIISKSTGGTWFNYGVPDDSSSKFVGFLKVIDSIWHYCLTLTTFVLTFFVTQAYSFWREMYTTARKLQGRLNDIMLLVSSHTARDETSGSYTSEGNEFLDNIAQTIRLISPLAWASASRRYRVLLTNRGMKGMVDRKFMTQKQMDSLLNLKNVSRKRLHYVCLQWLLVRIRQGRDAGIHDANGHLIQEKASAIRGAIGSIGDDIAGRMPLVYAHFVQVLVDFFLFGAPFALYSELGSLSVICVGILTLFYEGLLDLAKVFLDPLENEDYCDGGIEMNLGVLIRETNAASVAWKNGIETIPF